MSALRPAIGPGSSPPTGSRTRSATIRSPIRPGLRRCRPNDDRQRLDRSSPGGEVGPDNVTVRCWPTTGFAQTPAHRRDGLAGVEAATGLQQSRPYRVPRGDTAVRHPKTRHRPLPRRHSRWRVHGAGAPRRRRPPRSTSRPSRSAGRAARISNSIGPRPPASRDVDIRARVEGFLETVDYPREVLRSPGRSSCIRSIGGRSRPRWRGAQADQARCAGDGSRRPGTDVARYTPPLCREARRRVSQELDNALVAAARRRAGAGAMPPGPPSKRRRSTSATRA